MRFGDVSRLFEEINGSPTYVGTQAVTATVSSFTVVAGARYILQPDAALYIQPGATGQRTKQAGLTVPTLTASNGLKLAADEKFYICMMDAQQPGQGAAAQTTIQMITAAGTANCRVFRID